jgi:hypothetical protein
MSKSVTVILNGYKRNHLKEQVNAIKNQSVPVEEIFYWQNTCPGFSYDEETYSELNSALSNYNYGVWSRFAYALNARTDYVIVIDDDTIPGSRYIENCINTHETHPGLLVGIGLWMKNKNYDLKWISDTEVAKFGWQVKNERPVEVDFGGHSWFFARDLLSVFWRELPKREWSLLCGEDMHFSAMLQKYTDLKTWVPPHPENDPTMWSSLKALEYGCDHLATANINCQTGEMKRYLSFLVDNGFKLICEK